MCYAGLSNINNRDSRPDIHFGSAGPPAQRHGRCVGAEVGRHNGTATQTSFTSTSHVHDDNNNYDLDFCEGHAAASSSTKREWRKAQQQQRHREKLASISMLWSGLITENVTR